MKKKILSLALMLVLLLGLMPAYAAEGITIQDVHTFVETRTSDEETFSALVEYIALLVSEYGFEVVDSDYTSFTDGSVYWMVALNAPDHTPSGSCTAMWTDTPCDFYVVGVNDPAEGYDYYGYFDGDGEYISVTDEGWRYGALGYTVEWLFDVEEDSTDEPTTEPSTAPSTTPVPSTGGRQVITVNPITIEVGGKRFAPVDANGSPVHVFEYGGTTYAPLRALAEAYGLTVGYNAAQNLATVTGTATLTDYHGVRGTVMTQPFQLVVSPISVMVNNTIFQPRDANGAMVSVFESGGTTYAPLRALAEAYGLKVGYNAERRLAYVYTEGAEPIFATAPEGGVIIDDPLTAADMDQAATSPYIVQDILMFTNGMVGNQYYYYSGNSAKPENGSWSIELKNSTIDGQTVYLRDYLKEYTEVLAQNGFEILAVEDDGIRYIAALASTRADTERTVNAYVNGEYIPCDVYVNSSYPGIQWGDEFDLGDAGLRSQLVEKHKNWSEVEGYYAADAFYRRGTEYANLSDSFLTTYPGGATLILNDTMRLTGDASLVHDIVTGKPDLAILTITGFDGDKAIEISLPVNGTVADGDVFTLADFYHNGSAGDRTYELENGSGYGATVMYLPYGNSDYRHMTARSMNSLTVRVLEWDETGESDSVIYFNIVVNDGNGNPYNVEGLAAAPLMPEEPVHENTAMMGVGTTMQLRFGYDSGATIETYEWSLVTGTAVEFVGATNSREVTIQAVTTGEVEVMCRYTYLVDSTDVLTGNPTRETRTKTERFWIEVS